MTHDSVRLWHKGGSLDEFVHRFTVGDDPHWDCHLAHWDCLGSAAHARTLAQAGLLTPAELNALLTALAQIDKAASAGDFVIPPALEDVHTAIENQLTQQCGEAGRKIHTGRSRNDQVATALRLFLRNQTLAWISQLDHVLVTLTRRATRDGDVPMPGYTHLQPAMPSSFGQWLQGVAEALLEQVREAAQLLDVLDSCPLGTGAGYGVPLPIDRTFTARLLGFGRVQRSPLDVQASRGRLEKYFVRLAADVGLVLEKLSCDLILFNTAEFGFVRLPDDFTTGSSIMPQKRNPDVLELLRARAARLRARVIELEQLTARLTSGYHRDLQLTKEPTIRTALELPEMLAVATRVIEQLVLQAPALEAALRPELYATHAAVARVQAGQTFRDAYRAIGQALAAGSATSELAAGRQFAEATRAGRVPPKEWAALQSESETIRATAAAFAGRIRAAEVAVLPVDGDAPHAHATA